MRLNSAMRLNVFVYVCSTSCQEQINSYTKLLTHFASFRGGVMMLNKSLEYFPNFRHLADSRIDDGKLLEMICNCSLLCERV